MLWTRPHAWSNRKGMDALDSRFAPPEHLQDGCYKDDLGDCNRQFSTYARKSHEIGDFLPKP